MRVISCLQSQFWDICRIWVCFKLMRWLIPFQQSDKLALWQSKPPFCHKYLELCGCLVIWKALIYQWWHVIWVWWVLLSLGTRQVSCQSVGLGFVSWVVTRISDCRSVWEWLKSGFAGDLSAVFRNRMAGICDIRIE